MARREAIRRVPSRRGRGAKAANPRFSVTASRIFVSTRRAPWRPAVASASRQRRLTNRGTPPDRLAIRSTAPDENSSAASRPAWRDRWAMYAPTSAKGRGSSEQRTSIASPRALHASRRDSSAGCPTSTSDASASGAEALPRSEVKDPSISSSSACASSMASAIGRPPSASSRRRLLTSSSRSSRVPGGADGVTPRSEISSSRSRGALPQSGTSGLVVASSSRARRSTVVLPVPGSPVSTQSARRVRRVVMIRSSTSPN